MSDFEKKHVHQFYKDSSQAFSATRYRTWPKVEQFYSMYVKDTDVVLDAGSGNGRNTLFPNRTLSVDFSQNLLAIAQSAQKGLFYGKLDLADTLPIKPNTCDIVISIAVIHHLSTEDRRVSAVGHMIESLKPGGYLLLYVWSESPESKPSKFVSLSNFTHPELKDTLPNITGNDVFVGWKNTNTLNRYYHLFRDKELEEMLEQHPISIKESGKDHGNYFVICQKLFTSI